MKLSDMLLCGKSLRLLHFVRNDDILDRNFLRGGGAALTPPHPLLKKKILEMAVIASIAKQSFGDSNTENSLGSRSERIDFRGSFS